MRSMPSPTPNTLRSNDTELSPDRGHGTERPARTRANYRRAGTEPAIGAEGTTGALVHLVAPDVSFGARYLRLEMDVRCARYGALEQTFLNAALVCGCRGHDRLVAGR